jgi:2,3,4,5-tetrahydropyridine-2-carboxylate N-succinyltransferase
VTDLNTLAATIDEAFERRADITAKNSPPALAPRHRRVHRAPGFGAGARRGEEGRRWTVNQWLKKAVLLYFRTHDNAVIEAGYTRFFDKVPLKYAARSQADEGEALRTGGTRVVPPAVARRGSYIGPNTVLMPSYVNIGAYVDSGTMVDTWATVGSCAQIGKNVHLSGGVGIGGVLEPLQAAPPSSKTTASSVRVGSRRRRDRRGRLGDLDGRVHRPEHQDLRPRHRPDPAGTHSAGSVVVSGNLPSSDGKYSLYCAVIVKRVDAQTRAKTSINELLRAD